MATILPCGPVKSKTYTAVEAMPAANRIVKLTAASTVGLCDAAEKCLGVVKNEPVITGQASVVELGETEVYVDATTAIVIDDYIFATTDGVGIKCPLTAATKYYVIGRAKEAKASGTGTIIVDVLPSAVTVPA